MKDTKTSQVIKIFQGATIYCYIYLQGSKQMLKIRLLLKNPIIVSE